MRLSELDGRRVGIWGAGREGRAASAAVEWAGGRVMVMSTDDEPKSVERLRECEVVIRSPGVSRYRPELSQLAAAGVTLTTGTNLFFAEPRAATTVGVTGTKGKSTTSAMLAHLLRSSGTAVELGGNIGLALLDLLQRPEPEVYVVELSSFQISDLERGPDVAVVLNLFREHLDWHGSEDAYARDKLRLLGLPGVEHVVLPAGEDRLLAAAWPGPELVTFAAAPLDTTAIGLRGEHNRLNLGAALAAAGILGIDLVDPAAAMAGFEALPHRLEVVVERGGVTWVNDSIATTPEAAIAALEAFGDRPVTLIAGGYDRGQDYAALGAAIDAHPARAELVTLPETGPRIAVATSGASRAASDLDEAVSVAAVITPSGGAVLLSPAAPSFGAFRDFEERGERFRAAVERLDAS